MVKQNTIKLLYELIKNSKRSDREIAKIIGVSQPTITRTRQKLEKTGYIRDYTVIPHLEKLGFEIAAFTFANVVNPKNEDLIKYVENNTEIIYSAFGEGLDAKNFIIVSIHTDFIGYTKFMSDLRSKTSGNLLSVDNFLIPLGMHTPKPFSFKYLAGAQ